MGKILDGKKLADLYNLSLKEQIKIASKETGIKPKLVTILVGEDTASKVYINIKYKTCGGVGIESLMVNLEENITKENLIKEIEKLNKDKSIHGILLQLPIPHDLRDFTSEILSYISPIKDIDGFHPLNRGKLFDYNEELVACTPQGIIAILEENQIDLQGKDVVIVNRSNLVGKPLIFMLLKRNATITVCHTSTRDINSHIKRAEILIVAVGKPNFITKDMIKENVVIIDVGTNRVNGKLCGDVDFNGVLDRCGNISPVPGGIGPLTVSFLLQNTFIVYKKQLKI